MAAPTLVAVGSTGAASGPGGVATMGLPAGVQPGDVLVMCLTINRGTASGTAGFSFSTLWNQVQNRGVNNGSVNTALGVMTRIYTPSDPAEFTITISSSEDANTAVVGFIAAFRGVDHSSLTWMGGFSSAAPASSAVANANVTAPAAPIIDNHDGAVALAIVNSLGTSGPFGIPSGWTQTAQVETPLGPVGACCSVFHRAYAAGATATDNAVVTGSVSTTKGAWQIVLNGERPADSGTGPRVRSSTMHAAYWNVANLPLNKPKGTQPGDLMVAVVAVDAAGQPTAETDIQPPVGWTEWGWGQVSGTVGAGHWRGYYRYAAAGEPDSYIFSKGVQGDGVGGIISFIDAGPPRPELMNYDATGTAFGDITMSQVFGGQANDAVLAVVLAGTGSNAYRSFTTPDGWVERVDERPPIGSSQWNALGMWTKKLLATGGSGDAVTTLLGQTSNLSAPAPGITANYTSVQLVIPAKGIGQVNLSGEGSVSFGPVSASARGSLSLSGSGGATFGATATAAKGALSLSGSGALALSGKATPGSSIQIAGAGQLTFPTQRAGARGALALTGSGSLLVTGGGGAGVIALAGAGQVTFSSRPGPRATLALSGSGTLAANPFRIGGRGSLARTGSGSLGFTQRVGLRGTVNLSGFGELVLGFGGITTKLQAWDAATSQWRPVIVRGWDSVNGVWRLVKGLRRKNGGWS